MTPDVSREDWERLHYATGLLLGLAHKYGLIDVTIYYDAVHIRIEQIREEKRDQD